VHISPAPPHKEEAEVTALTPRPRASSSLPESSRLSTAFTLAFTSERSLGFGATCKIFLPLSLISEDSFPDVEPALYALAEEVLLVPHGDGA
jgi:hypothetical protein